MLKVDELEEGLKVNKTHFREVMCLKNESCNELAYASKLARNMATYRKREIFGEAKMLKL